MATRLPAVAHASGLVLALLLALATTRADAQQAAVDSIARACVAADTSTRWREVAAAWSEADRPASDASLRLELLALLERDQALRTVPAFGDSIQSASFRARLLAADSANAAALRAIVRRHGWPTRSLAGTDGASAAFLIAQHDAGLQSEVLPLLLALPAGEIEPADLALFHDRVLVGEGKAQRYGSQTQMASDGRTLSFPPIEDLPRLDARRAEVGLFPFGVYLCIVRGAYGMDVRDPRAQ